MNVKLTVLAGGVALTTAATVLTGSPASAGPGLSQSASSKLSLPAVQSASIIRDCENGKCTDIASPALAAQALAIDVTYTLLNAASLPNVTSLTGKPLVTTDGCNGLTGVALAITGTNVGSTNSSVSVNGQPLDAQRPTASGSHNGYSRSICLPL